MSMEPQTKHSDSPGQRLTCEAERAVKILLAQYKRQDGKLSPEDIDRVVDGRELSVNDAFRVLATLDAQGVQVQSDDAPALIRRLEASTHASNLTEILRHSEPLLTSAEEVQFARTIRLAKRAHDFLGQRPETEADVDELRTRGIAARQRMLMSNVRLVADIAFRYATAAGLDVEDVFQEGMLGLMKALDKFDYAKGFKFSTYATWWIRQSITRALDNQGRTVRLPVHVLTDIRRLIRASRSLQAINRGRKPNLRELSDELDWANDKIQFISDLAQLVIASLDVPVGEDGTPLLEMIADDAPTPADDADRSSCAELLQELLHELSPRDRRVITLRYGLGDDQDRTLEEVGKLFELTRERIRQIQERALRKLRTKMNIRELDGDDFY